MAFAYCGASFSNHRFDLGYPKKYTPGIVLNIIGLMGSVANAAIGAYMGANGQLF